jgi:hypothetical protein
MHTAAATTIGRTMKVRNEPVLVPESVPLQRSDLQDHLSRPNDLELLNSGIDVTDDTFYQLISTHIIWFADLEFPAVFLTVMSAPYVCV